MLVAGRVCAHTRARVSLCVLCALAHVCACVYIAQNTLGRRVHGLIIHEDAPPESIELARFSFSRSSSLPLLQCWRQQLSISWVEYEYLAKMLRVTYRPPHDLPLQTYRRPGTRFRTGGENTDVCGTRMSVEQTRWSAELSCRGVIPAHNIDQPCTTGLD